MVTGSFCAVDAADVRRATRPAEGGQARRRAGLRAACVSSRSSSWIELDTIWLERRERSQAVLSVRSSASPPITLRSLTRCLPDLRRPVPRSRRLKQLNERTVLEAILSAPRSRGPRSPGAPGSPSRPSRSLCSRCWRPGSCARSTDPGGPSYGAVFFEPVPDAALVLGLDLGARFLRGAICDLGGAVRARTSS